jgi:hypothetical protein
MRSISSIKRVALRTVPWDFSIRAVKVRLHDGGQPIRRLLHNNLFLACALLLLLTLFPVGPAMAAPPRNSVHRMMARIAYQATIA